MNNDFSKYRVYDTERGEYCDPQDVTLAADGELYEVCIFSDEGGVYFEKVEDDRYIVERCTGCRDMHNTPIYDGDIFKYMDVVYVVRIGTRRGAGLIFCAFEVGHPYITWGDICGGMPNDTEDPDWGAEILGTIHDPVYKNCEGDRC